MKKFGSKHLFGKVFALFALAAAASTASAVPIVGEFGLGGGAYSLPAGSSLDNTTSLILDDVWGIDCTNPSGCGDLSNINFFSTGSSSNPLDFGSTVNNLFTIEGWQVDITNSVVSDQNSSFLNLAGSGTISCIDTNLCGGTNFDPTAITWNLSAQSVGSTYSMSIAAVPVPAALWLFGSGLLAMVGLGRRRTR